ncbi:MAG: restriction endonuclease subunit S [Campylobacter lanienae]|nr:restriction endonuclease subunit S [Campylobacter lanienae]
MSKLEELINKLCPNGVEFKKTKDLKRDSFWLMPATPNYIDKGVPYITSKNIRNGKIDFENVNYISQEDFIKISANRKIEKNDLLVTMIGTIGETAFVGDYCDFYGQNMYLIRLDENKINAKFFNYYLTSAQIKNSLISRKNTSSQGYIKAGSLEELSVPVPPLEVQCEIVRILDNFTLLSAELSAELSARQKQYEYYSKELFNFNDDVEFISLESIADIGTGSSNTNEAVEDGQYPFYVRSQQVYYKNNYEYDDNSIITSGDGVGVGKIFHYTDGKYALHQRAYRINITNNKVNSKYFYYYMKSTFYDYIQKNAFNSSVTSIRRPMLNKYPVPILSLEKQNKIVNILEKFEKLCNDISEGLPAEIEARKKQYEYYRDKLLTFKELKK